jgi:hypothetical protein
VRTWNLCKIIRIRRESPLLLCSFSLSRFILLCFLPLPISSSFCLFLPSLFMYGLFNDAVNSSDSPT